MTPPRGHRERGAGAGPRDWDAATYDRIADPMTRWGAEVLARLVLDGDETVLDAGAGSGRVTEMLLERLPTGRVVALDAAPSMLAEARKRLARFAPGGPFVESDLLELSPARAREPTPPSTPCCPRPPSTGCSTTTGSSPIWPRSCAPGATSRPSAGRRATSPG